MDAAGVGYDGRRLLRTPTLSEYEACLQVVEIEIAEFLDSDCLMIELALLGWVVTLRNPALLNFRLFPC